MRIFSTSPRVRRPKPNI